MGGAERRASAKEPALPAALVLRGGRRARARARGRAGAREGRGPAQALCEAVEESSL